MKILSIDPGPTESAALILESGSNRVIESKHLPNTELLECIENGGYLADRLAIETIQCFGMPAGQEMFMTMFWVGRFCQAFKGGPFQLVKRSDVKMHLCASTRAKDANIRQSLIDRFGKPGTKNNKGKLYGISNHLWSALAIAVTVADTINQPTPQKL